MAYHQLRKCAVCRLLVFLFALVDILDVLSVPLFLFPSVAVSLTSVSRSLSGIMQAVQSVFGNLSVSQQDGIYPSYAKSSSIGLGIFHLTAGLIFLIGIIGVATLKHATE